MPELYRSSGARFGAGGRYRYLLWRAWDDRGPRMLFVMLNPSSADDGRDDPTIRRCVRFARRHGCGSLAVANLFALRATDPRTLLARWRQGGDVVGPRNDQAIVRAAEVADVIVLAWGRHGRLMGRD